MNPAIHIAVIILAIAFVGMAVIAVNYSPVPAHAQQCKGWLFPESQGQVCYHTKKECESHLPAGSTATCTKSKR